MRDLSLHIMDLVQNSITAGASLIETTLCLDADGMLTLTIKDDGCGMDSEMVQKVISPFSTTRSTRKVGLGIPMTLASARATGGQLTLNSSPGKGTEICATFLTDNIDCLPLGDIAETFALLTAANPDTPDFVLTMSSPDQAHEFDTRVIREALGGVKLNEPEVMEWILTSLREQAGAVFGGKLQ